MLRVLLIVIVFLIAGFAIYAFLKRRSKQEAESDIEVDDKTYTLELMTAFVKRRLDEITKINLYDIGLSEEELKRRKQKKVNVKLKSMLKMPIRQTWQLKSFTMSFLNISSTNMSLTLK